MKTSTNFARVAVTAGLTAVMTLGNVVAPAAMALADTGSTVTFTDVDYAASTTYKGIQIFKAKVATTGGTQTVSNIEWANDDAKKAVLDAIKTKDASFAGENAQDAADWLNVNAGGFPGTGAMVASNDVLSMIAANLKGSNLWSTTTKGNASLSGLEAGYWLFLTDTAGTPRRHVNRHVHLSRLRRARRRERDDRHAKEGCAHCREEGPRRRGSRRRGSQDF